MDTYVRHPRVLYILYLDMISSCHPLVLYILSLDMISSHN